MKITRRDLDDSILQKLDQLDNITAIPYQETDGFLSYNAKQGFYFKKTNDAFLRRLYDENALLELEKSLSIERDNTLSSSFKDLRTDKSKYNKAFSKFLYQLETKIILNALDEIIKYKIDEDGRLLVLDKKGNVFYQNRDESVSINVIETLKEFFAIQEVECFDITDINFFKDGFLFSVISNGIYYYSFAEKTLEMKVAEPDIKMFKLLKNDKIFTISNSACRIFDLNSGKKIESYYNLKNNYQVPHLLGGNDRNIFVVGESFLNHDSKLLHYWREDAVGLNYNNKDNLVAPHHDSFGYSIKFIEEYKHNLYIVGLYENKLFIWKYDLDSIHRTPTEMILDCIDFSKLSGFVCSGDEIYVTLENKLYLIKDNTVLLRLAYDQEISNISDSKDGLVGIAGESLVSIDIPEFKDKEEDVTFEIFNEKEECNNIDIMLANCKNIEGFKLFTKEDVEIIPSSVVKYNGSIILKLFNLHETYIKLKIPARISSSLDGIIVQKNKIFLR